ncbi:MAG: ABC transporter transmembrane domain-containing protein, partial [Sphingomonadales bacterium]
MSTNKKNKETKKGSENAGLLKSLKVIYAFVWPYKGLVLGALLFLVIAASAQLYIFYSLRDVVDQGFSSENPDVINNYFKMLFIVGAFWSTALFFRFRLVTLLGERVVADIRKKVHSNLVNMSPVFFETNRPGEISSRLTADTTLIQTVVGSSVSIALRSVFTMVGGMGLLFFLNPKLMGFMFLIFPVLGFAFLFFGKLIRKRTRSGQDRLAEVGAMAGEAFGSIQIVQAFTQEEQEKSRFGEAVEATFNEAKKRIAARSWMMGLITFLFFG